jgi:hypothetical protein
MFQQFHFKVLGIISFIAFSVLLTAIIPNHADDVIAASRNVEYIMDTVEVKVPIIKDELVSYLYCIRLIEANLNYNARRTGSQYVGGYQIGNSGRSEIGLKHMNNEGAYSIILKDDVLQDMIMLRYLQNQCIELHDYFIKYNNTRVGAWFVTNSGILAMSHLCGTNATKEFLDSKGTKIAKDGNKKPMTDYLQLNNFNIYVDSISNDAYLKRILFDSNFSNPL